MSLNRPLTECLLRIRNLDEFKPLRDHLAGEKAKHLTFLVGCNEDRPLHVAQGMVRALGALTDLIEQAPSLLDKGQQ